MVTLLGLDLSLSATGVAVWRTGQGLRLQTIREPGWDEVCPAWRIPARCVRIADRIMEMVEPAGRTVAVIEGLIKPSAEQMRGTSTLDIAQLRGAVETELVRAGVPFTHIYPSTLKAYAVHGKATKDDMVAAARSVLGAAYPVGNGDEADAFWLAAMGLHQYGLPVVRVTPKRLRSLSTVDGWARFNLRRTA
jgi:Holliday junction resolvasome RuvABC endonuclease subunit